MKKKTDLERLLSMKLLRNDVLVEWEEAPEFYNPRAKAKIARPDGAPMERHYTGIVISKGPFVVDIEIGYRVFFDQFGRPERFDLEGRRFALLAEDALLMRIPKREVA